jgi:hypothetical protein
MLSEFEFFRFPANYYLRSWTETMPPIDQKKNIKAMVRIRRNDLDRKAVTCTNQKITLSKDPHSFLMDHVFPEETTQVNFVHL